MAPRQASDERDFLNAGERDLPGQDGQRISFYPICDGAVDLSHDEHGEPGVFIDQRYQSLRLVEILADARQLEFEKVLDFRSSERF